MKGPCAYIKKTRVGSRVPWSWHVVLERTGTMPGVSDEGVRECVVGEMHMRR